MNIRIEEISAIKDDLEPDKILLYTDSEEMMDDIVSHFKNDVVIICTNNPPLSSLLQRHDVRLRKTQYPPEKDLNVLEQAKELVLTCFAEGLLNSSDRILFIISTSIHSVMIFNMHDIGVANLKDMIQDRLDIRVVEAAFKIASMIVKEGKEGLPVGSLLILGDVNRVMNQTRDLIKDPLEGNTDPKMNIKDKEYWPTIKEYSMLDGAMIIDKNGRPISAGRYVMFAKENNIKLKEGLGGRHLAAASITDKTMAIALVVSSEGTIQIYKDGEEIYKIETM